jgi:cytochrome c oxidase assembly protein subunit 15
LNLAHLSISIHLLFAILLLQLQLALLLSLRNKLFSISVSKKVQIKLFAFLIVLLIQSVLGTQVRMYVDDVSKVLHYEQRETWLADMPVSFLLHRSFSWFVLVAALLVSWHSRNIIAIKKKIFILTGIIILNMIAGITLYYADMPAIAQPIHLLLAACAITQTMSILLQIDTSRKPLLNEANT